MRAVRYRPLGLPWQPVSTPNAERITSHLHTILRSWEGTPYMAGQQMQQVGVDCVRFVCAVYDALLGLGRTATPLIPQDTAMHKPRTAVATMRQIGRLYPDMKPLRDPTHVEPGDLLVVGHEEGGPGHAILVGPEPNTLWQTGTQGVYKGGLVLMAGTQKLFRVYRLRNREAL